MVRLLFFLVVLALAAFGLTWLANNPGEVALTWRGVEYEVSLMFALGVVFALAIALGSIWTLIRFVFRIPSLVTLASRARRREKGYQARLARNDRDRFGRCAGGDTARRAKRASSSPRSR